MRLSIFLALVILTFSAYISPSSAESAPLLEQERNVRAEQGGLVAKADDIAANFLQTLRKDAMLSKAAALEKIGNTRRADVLKNTAGAVSRLNKAQKEKLAVVVAEMAKKDPKKWSTLKKVLVGALGITVAGGIIYAAQKLMS